MKRVLYCCWEKSIHDIRIIELLNTQYAIDVVELIHNPTMYVKDKFDLIVKTPLWLNTTILNLNFSPIVLMSMGYDLNNSSNHTYQRSIQDNLNQAQMVVVDNPLFEPIVRQKFKFTNQIFYMPYGCDLEIFSGIVDSPRYVLGTNRAFSKHYQNELILKAVSELQNTEYNKFVMMEHGSLYNEFMVDHQELLQKIKFEIIPGGDVKNVIDFLKNITFYISASKSDGSSVSMLEAMAARKVCIVPDTKFNSYWIEDEVNGYLFKNGSKAHLLDTIRKALSLTDLKAKQIGDAAQKRVEKEADWNSNSKMLLNAINSII
jgi:glycosyltransferase involved in cell wall biosynthesis